MDQGLTNLTKDIILPINTILILPSFLVTIFHAEKLQSAPNREDMKIICKVSALTLVRSIIRTFIYYSGQVANISVGRSSLTKTDFILVLTRPHRHNCLISD